MEKKRDTQGIRTSKEEEAEIFAKVVRLLKTVEPLARYRIIQILFASVIAKSFRKVPEHKRGEVLNEIMRHTLYVAQEIEEELKKEKSKVGICSDLFGVSATC